MSSPPWAADRNLTPDTASAVIKASFPAIDTEQIEHLGSGWEYDAFLTRDGWVFRFPRRKEYAGHFEQERRVHRLVSSVLPADVSVPQVEVIGRSGVGFPYRFAGHRFISGVTADAIDSNLLPELARDVGIALGAIHSISEEAARAAGIREMDADDLAGRFGWVEAAFALHRLDPVVDLALEWFREIPLPTAPFDGHPRLIHQDMGVDHLIIDPNTGRLAGILDWTDTILGDPARDFVFLVTWKGWDLAEETFRSYPHHVDQAFRERLGFMSRLLSIMYLTLANEQHFDLTSCVEGVRNAFTRGMAL